MSELDRHSGSPRAGRCTGRSGAKRASAYPSEGAALSGRLRRFVGPLNGIERAAALPAAARRTDGADVATRGVTRGRRRRWTPRLVYASGIER